MKIYRQRKLEDFFLKMKNNKIKIICTLGPSSFKKKVLSQLKKEKIDIFRINLSHTKKKDIEKSFEDYLKMELVFIYDDEVDSKLTPEYEKKNKDSESDARGDSGWNLEIQVNLGASVFSMSLVLDKNRLSLACWVPDQSLYQKIHNNEHVLKSILFDQGLELLSFELHDFATSRFPGADTGSQSRIKLDV